MRIAAGKRIAILSACLSGFFLIAASSTHGRIPSSATVYAAQAATGNDAAAQPTTLSVAGDVPTPLTLTADDLAKMPRATASVTSDGQTVNYEGVLLYDVLAKAGWPFSHGMKGKPTAGYAIVTGKDGFKAVFSLAEIDPAFVGSKVLIADKADGYPLPAKYRPFRVISVQDKAGARSIYSLIKIEVFKVQ